MKSEEKNDFVQSKYIFIQNVKTDKNTSIFFFIFAVFKYSISK